MSNSHKNNEVCQLCGEPTGISRSWDSMRAERDDLWSKLRAVERALGYGEGCPPGQDTFAERVHAALCVINTHYAYSPPSGEETT